MLKFFIFSFVLFYTANAAIPWTDCGTGAAAGKITGLDVTPQPIVHPGVIDVTFQANTKRDIKGAIKTELNIVRSVSGIALPIRCYLASGLYVGSCTYNDGCKDLLQDILNITAANGNCPPPLAAIGIDCSCPFNIPQNNNINLQFPSNIEDLSTSVASFLASGDFKIRLKATGPAPTNEVGCLEFSISMKPASGGR